MFTRKKFLTGVFAGTLVGSGVASAQAFAPIPSAGELAVVEVGGIQVVPASSSQVAVEGAVGVAPDTQKASVLETVTAQANAEHVEAGQGLVTSGEPVASNPPVQSKSKAEIMVNTARSLIGTNGIWCNQLVSRALASVGINFDGFPVQFKALGVKIPASEALPGDLVIWDSNGMVWGAGSPWAGQVMQHIALYTGNGKAVHGGWLSGSGVTVAEATIQLAKGASEPAFYRVV